MKHKKFNAVFVMFLALLMTIPIGAVNNARSVDIAFAEETEEEAVLSPDTLASTESLNGDAVLSEFDTVLTAETENVIDGPMLSSENTGPLTETETEVSDSYDIIPDDILIADVMNAEEAAEEQINASVSLTPADSVITENRDESNNQTAISQIRTICIQADGSNYQDTVVDLFFRNYDQNNSGNTATSVSADIQVYDAQRDEWINSGSFPAETDDNRLIDMEYMSQWSNEQILESYLSFVIPQDDSFSMNVTLWAPHDTLVTAESDGVILCSLGICVNDSVQYQYEDDSLVPAESEIAEEMFEYDYDTLIGEYTEYESDQSCNDDINVLPEYETETDDLFEICEKESESGNESVADDEYDTNGEIEKDDEFDTNDMVEENDEIDTDDWIDADDEFDSYYEPDTDDEFEPEAEFETDDEFNISNESGNDMELETDEEIDDDDEFEIETSNDDLFSPDADESEAGISELAIFKTSSDITVKKIWDDISNQEGLRPASVTVQLYSNENEYGDPVTLSGEDDEWTYTWESLPLYSTEGEVLHYTAKEISDVDWYEVSYSDDGLTITNRCIYAYTEEETETDETETEDGDEEFASFYVSTIWEDDDNQNGRRPDSVTIRVYANGVEIMKQDITEEDGWNYDFTDLPKYDENGEIRYSVSEDPVNYYESIMHSLISSPVYTSSSYYTVNGYAGFDFVNYYTGIPNSGTKDITVTKIWEDVSNKEGLRPDSISVQLYANGDKYADPVTVSGTGDQWEYTWTDLQAYDEDGETIVYTAKEIEEIEGYATSYSNDGLTITNTCIDAGQSFELKKTDENSNIIQGAVFTLKNENGNIIYFEETDDGYVQCSDTAANAVSDIVAGDVWISGLSSGTYSLTETKAPDGYILENEPVSVVIDESGDVKYDGMKDENGNVINIFPVEAISTMSVVWTDSDGNVVYSWTRENHENSADNDDKSVLNKLSPGDYTVNFIVKEGNISGSWTKENYTLQLNWSDVETLAATIKFGDSQGIIDQNIYESRGVSFFINDDGLVTLRLDNYQNHDLYFLFYHFQREDPALFIRRG